MSGYYIKQPPLASSLPTLPHPHYKSANNLQAASTCNTALLRLFSLTSLVLLLSFSISHIPQSDAFNLENRLPVVKYGPHANSYFGYSIATHTVGEYNWPNNTKWWVEMKIFKRGRALECNQLERQLDLDSHEHVLPDREFNVTFLWNIFVELNTLAYQYLRYMLGSIGSDYACIFVAIYYRRWSWLRSRRAI